MGVKLQAEIANREPGGVFPEPGWHVAYTQPRREKLAAFNLEQQGFETYLPQYKTFRQAVGGSSAISEPMFPRYLFFRPCNARQSVSSARHTRGVSFIIFTGSDCAVLSASELGAIRACEYERNHAPIEEIGPFRPGLQVRLRDCGLQGLEGLVKSVAGKRVTLLLEILGRAKLVSVDPCKLEVV